MKVKNVKAKVQKPEAVKPERIENTVEEMNARFKTFEFYKGKTRTNGKTGKERRLY